MAWQILHYGIFLIFFVGGFALPAKNLSPLADEIFDRPQLDGRIVGGSVAGDGSYPWMVAITTGFMTNIFLCGGAVITNRHVLTAAHCIDALLSSQFLNARVNVGTNKWDNGNANYSLRIIARNPEYDAVTRKNDIGIMGTARTITFNNRVQPIPVSYDFVPGGILVRVSGWGWLKAGGNLSELLQELRLLTMDGESCVAEVRRIAQSLGMSVPSVDPNIGICTFLTGNEGICIGDGGSPLVHNTNNHLIGVASWGVLCARGAPDIFTRVSVYRDWIQTVLDIEIPSLSERSPTPTCINGCSVNERDTNRTNGKKA